MKQYTYVYVQFASEKSHTTTHTRKIYFLQFSETDLFLHIPDTCWFQKVLSTHTELRVKSTVMELIYKELILKCPDNCIIEKDFIFGVWVFIQI